MNTPIQLIRCMFQGGVATVQGFGSLIYHAFQSVLHGDFLESGDFSYMYYYTDLAKFLFTFGGIALGIGAAWFFLRLLKRRGKA